MHILSFPWRQEANLGNLITMSPTATVTAILLVTLMLALLVIVQHDEIHTPSLYTVLSKLFWKNATVRPPLLIVLVVGGWGWVISVCQAARLEVDHVLGGPVQMPGATYHAALQLLCLLLAAHLLHFWASETPGVTWRPWLVSNCALNVAFFLIGALPCNLFYGDSRLSLLRTLFESLIAPFAPVTFWHVIVADYLTSLAKAMSDLQITMCISSGIFLGDADGEGNYARTTTLWHQSYKSCADSPVNGIFLALPFWLRLMQCLRVYSETREVKNLWNALKYSTAFPLVYAGYLKKHEPSAFHEQLFILCAVVQSTYCLIWDVHMDWGLFRRANLGGRYPDETGSAYCGGPAAVCAMREPLLVTRSKSVYILLCVFDLVLRFAWALSVFGGVPGRGLGMLFFEVIEILRRHVWAVFRIEWEVVAKVIYPAGNYANLAIASDDGEEDEEDED